MGDNCFDKNKKMLVMTEAYPYFLVGTIVGVTRDCVSIRAEFGVPLPLKDQVFNIKMDAISAFFIETENQKIPTVW